MCWGEGGDTIRRGHSRNASEPEHQVPCFRDPSAGRLSTPMGYSLPATTVGPPFLHPVPRCQELTSPAPASSARGVPALHPGADLMPPRTLCTNRGAHGLHGGEPGPAAVSHGTNTAHPTPADPRSRPGLHPSQCPDRLNPWFTLSLHGTWHISKCQHPVGGHKQHLTRSCDAGAQESCSLGLFFPKERVAMVTWKAHDAGDTASANRSEAGATMSVACAPNTGAETTLNMG